MRKVRAIVLFVLAAGALHGCGTAEFPKQDKVEVVIEEQYVCEDVTEAIPELVREYVARHNEEATEGKKITDYKVVHNEVAGTYTICGPRVLITLVDKGGYVESKASSVENTLLTIEYSMDILRKYRDSIDIIPTEVNNEINQIRDDVKCNLEAFETKKTEHKNWRDLIGGDKVGKGE